jgi:chitin disaccharide deacetylase
MRALIVNGDDFGSSRGVNRGIVEAHVNGILTSTSMMVDEPASLEAARLCARHPALGVGLHAVLRPPADPLITEGELDRQFERFIALTGRLPTHIDTHHNVHRNEAVAPIFLAAAERYKVPLRDHCGVRHISGFYGQWNGETHLEQVGVHALARLIDAEIDDGFNELCCHPGYPGSDLSSSYAAEREAELRTLCNPEVADLLSERGISLVSFREVPPP